MYICKVKILQMGYVCYLYLNIHSQTSAYWSSDMHDISYGIKTVNDKTHLSSDLCYVNKIQNRRFG